MVQRRVVRVAVWVSFSTVVVRDTTGKVRETTAPVPASNAATRAATVPVAAPPTAPIGGGGARPPQPLSEATSEVPVGEVGSQSSSVMTTGEVPPVGAETAAPPAATCEVGRRMGRKPPVRKEALEPSSLISSLCHLCFFLVVVSTGGGVGLHRRSVAFRLLRVHRAVAAASGALPRQGRKARRARRAGTLVGPLRPRRPRRAGAPAGTLRDRWRSAQAWRSAQRASPSLS